MTLVEKILFEALDELYTETGILADYWNNNRVYYGDLIDSLDKAEKIITMFRNFTIE